jgi:hypothetical protein
VTMGLVRFCYLCDVAIRAGSKDGEKVRRPRTAFGIISNAMNGVCDSSPDFRLDLRSGIGE